MKPNTNRRAFPRAKKSTSPTRNAFWFASWTVVYCLLPACCICSHVSTPASRVSVNLIIATPDLDRSNLGNARLQGLPADVLHGDPTGKKFDWVNSVFFFSYVSASPALEASCLTSDLNRFYFRYPPLFCPSSSLPKYFWAARLSAGAFAPRSWSVVVSRLF